MAQNGSGCPRIFFQTTLAVLCATLASAVHAPDSLAKEETKATRRASTEIIVAFDKAYPPHEFLQDGQPTGFNIDVLRACAEEMGVTIRFRPMAWAEIIPAIVRGDVDAACMVAKPERREKLDFTTETILDPMLGLFMRQEQKDIFTFNDLNGRTVAVQQDDIAASLLSKQAPEAVAVEMRDQLQALDLLVRGDVAAALVNITVAQYYVKKRQQARLRLLDTPIPVPPRVIGVKKGNAVLLAAFDRALARIKKTGRYRAICDSWFGARTFVTALTGVDIAKLIVTWVTAGGLIAYLLRRRGKGLHWFYFAAFFGIAGCTLAVVSKVTLSEVALLSQHAAFAFASFAALMGARAFFRADEPIGGIKQ